jgi:LuxR family maltose regulon positive regulatory protein
VQIAAAHGLLDAIEDGEVHTAHGVALAAQGRLDEALPALERGVRLRRQWGQKHELIDGLIELADGVAAAGDRGRAGELLAEADALLAACPDPGALAGRVEEARRRALGPRPAAGELSDRERTVLRLLAGDLSEREIADELYVSFNTVHSHVRAIYRKLGVTSRADAVARARAHQIT